MSHSTAPRSSPSSMTPLPFSCLWVLTQKAGLGSWVAGGGLHAALPSDLSSGHNPSQGLRLTCSFSKVNSYASLKAQPQMTPS